MQHKKKLELPALLQISGFRFKEARSTRTDVVSDLDFAPMKPRLARDPCSNPWTLPTQDEPHPYKVAQPTKKMSILAYITAILGIIPSYNHNN
jgi:hypothetical protein